MDKQLDKAQPGDVVTSDIVDSTGRVLMPNGATLTAQNLAILHQHGISHVEVRPPFNPVLADKARTLAVKYYAGHDLGVTPGPVLLGLRTEAELRRLEAGTSPLLRDCHGPIGLVPEPHELPSLCMDGFTPPELPAVVLELQELLTAPNPSNQAVAEAIGRSPGLAARLLRLVNSPVYGLAGKVDTLFRAVTIVGLRDIGMLATGMAMIEQFGIIPRSVVDMRSFLEHCLGTAIAARALAETTRQVSAEKAFVSGLLHDIGRLYFFTAFPERSRFCIDSARKHGRTLQDEEKAYFGVDHCTLGRQLLMEWRMPPSLCLATAFHHHPFESRDPLLPGIVHLANVLVHATGLGTSGECGAPRVSPGILELIPVNPDQLADLASTIEHTTEAVMAAFQ